MKYRNTIIGIAFFAIFILYFIIRAPYDKRDMLLQQKATHEMAFEGRIIEISTNRGVSMVKLNNVTADIMLEESRNYSLTPVFIGDYLKKGMIIKKNPYSDTLYIKNESSSIRAFFVLGDIRRESSK